MISEKNPTSLPWRSCCAQGTARGPAGLRLRRVGSIHVHLWFKRELACAARALKLNRLQTGTSAGLNALLPAVLDGAFPAADSSSQAGVPVVQSVVMKRALRKLGLAGTLVVLAVSLFATTSLAPTTPADTNFIDPQFTDDNPQVKQLMKELEKDGVRTDKLLDEHFLFASLLWGSVGVGYVIYARKQRLIVPFLGGVAMIAASYFIRSWAWMSVICGALIVATYKLVKQGY